MDTKAFIIKHREQPSKLYAKHDWNAKKVQDIMMMTKCNVSRKNKYKHEHVDGLKNKPRIIRYKLIIIRWCNTFYSPKETKTQ